MRHGGSARLATVAPPPSCRCRHVVGVMSWLSWRCRHGLSRSTSLAPPIAFWIFPAALSAAPSACNLASPVTLPTASSMAPLTCLAAPRILSLSFVYAPVGGNAVSRVVVIRVRDAHGRGRDWCSHRAKSVCKPDKSCPSPQRAAVSARPHKARRDTPDQQAGQAPPCFQQ